METFAITIGPGTKQALLKYIEALQTLGQYDLNSPLVHLARLALVALDSTPKHIVDPDPFHAHAPYRLGNNVLRKAWADAEELLREKE